jgi:hypothetical protein
MVVMDGAIFLTLFIILGSLLSLLIVCFLIVKSAIDERPVNGLGLIIGVAPFVMFLAEHDMFRFRLYIYSGLTGCAFLGVRYVLLGGWGRASLIGCALISLAVVHFADLSFARLNAIAAVPEVVAYCAFAAFPLISAIAMADILQHVVPAFRKRCVLFCPGRFRERAAAATRQVKACCKIKLRNIFQNSYRPFFRASALVES